MISEQNHCLILDVFRIPYRYMVLFIALVSHLCWNVYPNVVGVSGRQVFVFQLEHRHHVVCSRGYITSFGF